MTSSTQTFRLTTDGDLTLESMLGDLFLIRSKGSRSIAKLSPLVSLNTHSTESKRTVLDEKVRRRLKDELSRVNRPLPPPALGSTTGHGFLPGELNL